MAVVVTGASGFIGRATVAELLDQGLRVVAVDRQPPSLPPTPGLAAVRADLVDRDDLVRGALHDADAVIHLAGCPGVRDPRPGVAWHRHRDNVLATAAVLDAVPPATPLVVASSSSVYGGAAGRASRETDPLRPRGGYAASKVRVEALCRARLAAGGTVAVVRPFTVVGEHQRPDMALARWIAAAAARRPVTVLGSPARTRDLTDVGDAARVLVALVRRDVRGAVNLGTGQGHTLAAMVAAVGAALGVDVATYVVRAPRDEVPDTLADTTLLRRRTGIVPRTDLVAVVRRQAAAAGLLPAGAVPPAAADRPYALGAPVR